MIKAAGRGPLGAYDSVFLGLSRQNTEKLLSGQPIRVRLRQDLHADLPELTVVLLGGETEQDLIEDLRAIAPMRVGDERAQPTDTSEDHT